MAERRDSKNRILRKGEYQRSDGKYMYRCTDDSGNARFIYSWTLTPTDRPPKGKHSERCLREMEKDIARDLQDGIDVYAARKTTLNDFFGAYISGRTDLKRSTRVSYKHLYDKHIADSLGERKIAEIKYSDIKNLYLRLITDRGLKLGSVQDIQIVLHPVFESAVRDGYIRSNPTSGVIPDIKRADKCGASKRRALTADEQRAFMDFVKNSGTYRRWSPLFTFLLGTGCRIGEALGLTWNDCDLKNGVISITHSLIYGCDEQAGRYRFYISTPKTLSGIREIPMLDDVRQALTAEKERQEKNGFSSVAVDGYSGFVFLNSKNNVLISRDVDAALKNIVGSRNKKEIRSAEAEGREPFLLPHISAHNLRHTFCTRLCETEANIKVIQDVMGHANISTTMNIYAEATREKKQETFSALNGKLQIG